MKTLIFSVTIAAAILFFTSCEETDLLPDQLTEAEVVAGLKNALVVGTDTSVKIVSAVNGYYGDPIIKILLPPEADAILEHADHPLLQAVGIDSLLESVVLKMNRAAEDAAKEATPIFVNAITSMTFEDAFGILNGNDTSATHYLRENTTQGLYSAFHPEIQTSLNKPLIGGTSANEMWFTLTDTYNQVAQFIPGWELVQTDLDEYVTYRALNGLFVKIADEEKAIRNDPVARVTDILKKVFGGG